MSEERPITAEQALFAVEAAGLDPDRPLRDQLRGGQDRNMESRIDELGEKVTALSEALAGQGGEPADPQRRFAELYRDALNRSRTPWMGEQQADAA